MGSECDKLSVAARAQGLFGQHLLCGQSLWIRVVEELYNKPPHPCVVTCDPVGEQVGIVLDPSVPENEWRAVKMWSPDGDANG